MGFTSQDDLINQITTNGKYGTVVYQKTLIIQAVVVLGNHTLELIRKWSYMLPGAGMKRI